MSRSRRISWRQGKGLKWVRKHRQKTARQKAKEALNRAETPDPVRHRHSEAWDRW